MATWFVFAGLAVLIAAVAWRPHGWGPTLGALIAVGVAAAGGAVDPDAPARALHAQWPAYLTLASVMTMTSTAERMGLLDRLAAWIEPRTRGPVRHAFLVTFVLSAVVAAVLSNDAAILLLTPTVLALLRTVYPKRNPKFLAPFAIAVFAGAGVAPLVVSNPMNLIFADHMGIGFNRYAITMIPVALASWVATYYCLCWLFREPLADTAPALGDWPSAPPPLTRRSVVVLVTVLAVLLAYPILSYVGVPLWPAAVIGGAVCAAASLVSAKSDAAAALGQLGKGIAWTLFPFLMGVFILAEALGRIGAVAWLRDLYVAVADPTAAIGAVGLVSAVGSALLNNHPMSVLNAFALTGVDSATHALSYAALVGGDLGPRLLPIGSLASLIWYDLLRKHQVDVKVSTFVRTGLVLTAAPLAASLAALALLDWVLR